MEVTMGDDVQERLCGCGASMSLNQDGEWECDAFDGCDVEGDLTGGSALEDDDT